METLQWSSRSPIGVIVIAIFVTLLGLLSLWRLPLQLFPDIKRPELSIQTNWRTATIQDDPVKQSNKRGFVTFAKTGLPNSRSTQFYINYGDNSSLDPQGFAPFGQVISGMEFVDKLYTYGKQNVPDQGKITAEGNAYLQKEYPKLDYVRRATIEP